VGISLPTAVIVIRKSLAVKCFCITFILAAFLYQAEPAPAYQAAAQGDNHTNSQPTPSIEPPLGSAKAPVSPDKTEPAGHNMTSAEKWQLLIFGATGLFILWQAWTYHKQRQIMQGQLDITQELKALSERQADTFDKQVEKMQGQLDETRKIVSQNERAVKAAERNIEIIQEGTIYAQRAYVSVTRGDVMGDMFYIVIENSGHTPANDVEVRAVADIGEQPPDLETSRAKWTSMGVIAPDEYVKRMIVRVSGPEKRELLNNEGVQFYCVGIIRYKDIFKNPHQTKFCFSQRFGTNQFGPCATGNEAD
jgi:hypothetical protein